MTAVTAFDIIGDSIPYTPASDVVVGVPQQVAGRIGIPHTNLSADTLGSLQVKGIFRADIAAVTVVAEDVIGWDADGDPYGGTAGSGCYTNAPADWDFKVGVASEAATATSGEVKVVLNVFPSVALPSTITQTVAFGDFTDGGGTSGYADVTIPIPIGGLPIGWTADVTTAFAGTAGIGMEVGIAGDTDKYSGSSEGVDSAVLVGSLVSLDGWDTISTARTIRITLTDTTDFGAITAGEMDFTFYYNAA